MDQIRDLLGTHPFVKDLTSAEVDALAEHTTQVLFPANTRIFNEGGEAVHFWLIQEGDVRLDTVIPGQGQVIVETLGPGAVLGWSWLCQPRRWHFGAQTMTATAALQLDGPGVGELCQRDPVLGYKLMSAFLPVLVDRLQHTRIRLLDLYGGSS
jgi:CRP-like cAMP-binding protein